MLRHAGNAEIIADRAQRQHQIIVTDPVAAHQLAAILITDRRDHDLAIVTVDPFQRAEEEAVAPAIAMAAIADFIEIGVQGAGGHLMQQRLPDVGAVLLDQDDVEMLAPIGRAQLGRQLQPRRPAAHYDDLDLALSRIGYRHLPPGPELPRYPYQDSGSPVTRPKKRLPLAAKTGQKLKLPEW